jgi:hypothetical protein
MGSNIHYGFVDSLFKKGLSVNQEESGLQVDAHLFLGLIPKNLGQDVINAFQQYLAESSVCRGKALFQPSTGSRSAHRITSKE